MKRAVFIALAVAITAVVILFKIQNLDAVTVSLFSISVTMPTSLLVFLVYVLGMAHPLIRNANPAGKGDLAVHHQDLAVGAVIEAVEVIPAQRAIAVHVHAAAFYQIQKIIIHLHAASPVQKHLYLHSGAGALGQGLGKLLSDFTSPIDIGFKGEGFLC